MAVLGPVAGANIYVAGDGRWRGSYVPAQLRVYPFQLARQEGGYTLALWPDFEPESLGLEGVKPFFEEQRWSGVVQATFDFLREVEAGIAAADDALRALQDLSLLRPWVMPGLEAGGAVSHSEGLYRLDVAGFEALPDEQWLKFRRLRAIPWLYAHAHSLTHAEHFRARAARRVAEITQLAIQPKAPVQEVDSFLTALNMADEPIEGPFMEGPFADDD